jgi:hypothetical protein
MKRALVLRVLRASGLVIGLLNLVVIPVACSKSASRQKLTPKPIVATRKPPKAVSPQNLVQPNDLLDHPSRYLGHEVRVTIVESLIGPATDEALASVEYGAIKVWIPDNAKNDLKLVPSSFVMSSPDRYRTRFDSVIKGPLRVRGRFLSDAALAKDLGHPAYVLLVSSMSGIEISDPTVLPSLSEIAKGGWDRKLIVYEGVLTLGFESSLIDKAMWFTPDPDITTVGSPPPVVKGLAVGRVRVTGYLLAKPTGPAFYGHMGMGRSELLASKIEYLDPV